MSDTPRTDANYVCHYGDGLGQWVPREFACDLERELAAALEQRDKAREDALEEAAKVCEELRHPNWSEEDHAWIMGTEACAGAIRAMKVEK